MNGGHSSSNIWWRCTATIFRWLLGLYPRQFRDAYSLQMMQDFRDLWEEAALRSGAIGVCRLCWDTFGDLVATAVAERLRKDQAVVRSMIMRVSAAIVWATAVYAAASMLRFNLPFPNEVDVLFNWADLSFNGVFLAGLVGLQLKYRQRTPWYIWLIGSGTALAFFCWRFLPMLLTQWVYLVSGEEGLYSIYYNYSIQQLRSILIAIYMLYSVGMLVWGVSTLLKKVLPRWTAVLLMLFGADSLLWLVIVFVFGLGLRLDSLLRWPVILPSDSEGPFILPGFNVFIIPTVVYWTPYAFVHCALLASLGYALWVQNRLGRESAGPNGAGATPGQFAEGVDPAL